MTSTTHHRTDGGTTVAPAPPDLTTYYLVHRALRHGATRVAAAVESCEPGSDSSRPRAILRWYRGFATELHLHHTTEDTLHFPALAERVPVMAEHEARLEAEHDQIEHALERTNRALAQLAEMPVTVSSHGEAIAATRQLAHLLDQHLGYEDADVLPLFVRHFTAAEYGVLEEQTTKGASPKVLPFTVPFIAEAATPEELERVLAGMPAIIKVVLRLFGGRYARMTTAAFG